MVVIPTIHYILPILAHPSATSSSTTPPKWWAPSATTPHRRKSHFTTAKVLSSRLIEIDSFTWLFLHTQKKDYCNTWSLTVAYILFNFTCLKGTPYFKTIGITIFTPDPLPIFSHLSMRLMILKRALPTWARPNIFNRLSPYTFSWLIKTGITLRGQNDLPPTHPPTIPCKGITLRGQNNLPPSHPPTIPC